MNSIEQDCPRCGALLPDPEEGVCGVCGYEYGRATLYMPVVKLSEKKDVPANASATGEAGAAPSDGAPSPVSAAPDPQEAPQGKGLWILLGALVFLFLVVVVAIAALMFK